MVASLFWWIIFHAFNVFQVQMAMEVTQILLNAQAMDDTLRKQAEES